MDQTPHQKHIEAGFCSSISNTKAWCNLELGHPTRHMAPYLHPDGKQTPLWWTDEDTTPRETEMRP